MCICELPEQHRGLNWVCGLLAHTGTRGSGGRSVRGHQVQASLPWVNGKCVAQPGTFPVGFLKPPQALKGGAGGEPPAPGRPSCAAGGEPSPGRVPCGSLPSQTQRQALCHPGAWHRTPRTTPPAPRPSDNPAEAGRGVSGSPALPTHALGVAQLRPADGQASSGTGGSLKVRMRGSALQRGHCATRPLSHLSQPHIRPPST